MLKTVHTYNQRPIAYPVADTGTFQPGMIAQMKVVNNNVVLVVSDGTAPIGIIDDFRDIDPTTRVYSDTTAASGRLTIWPLTGGIFETDQYESSAIFATNAALFVSENGKLTTEMRFNNQPEIGMCIVPPTAHKPKIQFLGLASGLGALMDQTHYKSAKPNPDETPIKTTSESKTTTQSTGIAPVLAALFGVGVLETIFRKKQITEVIPDQVEKAIKQEERFYV